MKVSYHCGRIGGPVYYIEGEPCPECGDRDGHHPDRPVTGQALCGTCGKEPGFQCRAHFTKRITELEGALGEAHSVLRSVTCDPMFQAEDHELMSELHIEWERANPRNGGRTAYLWHSDSWLGIRPTEEIGDELVGIEVRYGLMGDLIHWAVSLSLEEDGYRVSLFIEDEDEAKRKAEVLVRAIADVWNVPLGLAESLPETR